MRKGTDVERTRRGLARAACVMRRALLVVMVLLAGPVAFAQVGSVAAGAKAVAQVTRTWSESEILSMFSAPVRKPVSWGRVVPFVGTAVVVGSLIYGALDWFYEEARRATGTALDEWYAASTGGARTVDAAACDGYSPCVAFYVTGDEYLVAYLSGYRWSTRPGSSSTNFGNYKAGYRRVGASDWGNLWWQTGTAGLWSDEPSLDGSAEFGNLWGATGTRYCTAGEYPPDFGGLVACVMGLVGPAVPSPDAGSLAQHVAGSPASAGALASRVVPEFLEEGAPYAPGNPYTYQEPYGAGVGVELDPVPTPNQWFDNAYADPNQDSDGDGWPDWKEVAAGTDPNSAASYPTVDPDPNQDSDGDGYPDWFEVWRGTDPADPLDYPAEAAPDPSPERDSDGDGIPDSLDPCPFDQLNACADGGGEQEFPDDIATESTLQGVLAAAERIADNTADEGGSPDVEALPGIVPDYDAWTPFPNTSTVWATAEGQVAADVAALQSTLSGKIPFGFASWFPSAPAVGSASLCSGIELEIASVETSINVCDNPLDSFMAGTGRSLLLALAYLSFILTVIRRVQQA